MLRLWFAFCSRVEASLKIFQFSLHLKYTRIGLWWEYVCMYVYVLCVCQLVEQIECRCIWLAAGEFEKQLPLTVLRHWRILYMSVRPSVGRSVGRSVSQSVSSAQLRLVWLEFLPVSVAVTPKTLWASFEVNFNCTQVGNLNFTAISVEIH